MPDDRFKRAVRSRGDVLLAAVLACAGQVEAWTALRLGGDGARLHHASLGQALVSLLATAPLAVRRSRPLLAAACVALAVSAQVLLVVPGLSLLAGLLPVAITIFSVAAYGQEGTRWAGVLVLVAATGVATLRVTEMQASAEMLFGAFALTGAALVGDTARRHRGRADRHVVATRRLEAERDAWRATAVAEERGRIARELHDVVAHSVSLMSVQAGAARTQLDRDTERAREGLLSIETTARETIRELRRLLDVLREDADGQALAPQPGIAEIEALVARVRAAGLPVELSVHKEAASVPPGVALSAYRIVQEALTNALKHAQAPRAQVRIAFADGGLDLTIADDGAGRSAPPAGRGHGLIGLQERAALYGGSLVAGPRPGGGFVVRATLPCGAPDA